MPTLQLSALQTAWMPHEKPPRSALPELPASPTLTNPDMVLPSSGMPFVSSPPRFMRRPPSPGYLRERPSERASSRNVRTTEFPGIGPISHTMLPSPQTDRTNRDRDPYGAWTPHSAKSYSSSERSSTVSSNPTVHNVGRLAPQQPSRSQASQRSTSGSSSSGYSGMTNFLARYPVPEPTSDDDVYDDGDAPDLEQCDTATEMEAEADEQRKIQEREEHNSAILSKRAEQILANAKQRLNVMEGNLRGARDLVAPLTAANLKRAASLGSAQYPPVLGDGYGYEFMRKPPYRTLHAQTSSPAIGRDFQAHARGFSETELQERPHTSLDQTPPISSRAVRLPVNVYEPSWAHGLRGSKSYDALGGHAMAQAVPQERPMRSRHSRASPDSGLEPLHEDEEPRKSSPQPEGSIGSGSSQVRGYSRPASQASDLREQLSNLKGRISSLKERAREESLKRQSLQTSRTSSPFNNAIPSGSASFYSSSSGYQSPVLNGNADAVYNANRDPPATPRSAENFQHASSSSIGNRNSLVHQSSSQQLQELQQRSKPRSQPVEQALNGVRTPNSKFQIWPTTASTSVFPSAHSRDISQVSYEDMPLRHKEKSTSHVTRTSVNDDEFVDASSTDIDDNQPTSSPSSSDVVSVSDVSYAESAEDHEDADNISVYEDAVPGQNQIVAHEDREDAFDYSHFFLHSAINNYNATRRGSNSNGSSVSSTETARGPGLHEEEDSDAFGQTLGEFPPPTPETPERLRAIEASLHTRPQSSDSISTFNTFATADEDQDERRYRKRSVDWTALPRPASAASRSKSRPRTAVKRPSKRDHSSERADSGVGLPRHSTGSVSSKRVSPPAAVNVSAGHAKIIAGSATVASPPMSPSVSQLQDPSSVAVHALLDPHGRQLGLRDNAILFGVIESLRSVVRRLQEDDETQHETRLLRRRLEEAKFVLDGA